MNIELHKILQCEDIHNVSEREIVLKGNIEPLYGLMRVNSESNHIVIYSNHSEIKNVIASFKDIKMCSIKNSQYSLIELSDIQIEKIRILMTAMDMDFIDIIYDLYIKDKTLEWRYY